MSDRELLELAAKAAGVTGTWVRWHQAYGDHWVEGLDCGGPIVWNPLADDGDALRLAVKLRLTLNIVNYGATARNSVSNPWANAEAHLYGGIEAATRRAIVRAAAELATHTAAQAATGGNDA